MYKRQVDIKDFIILQNKLDLIDESSNPNILKDIKNFVHNTIAENAKIIPSSIQHDVNRDEVIKNILNLRGASEIVPINSLPNDGKVIDDIRDFGE